jgi:hypothetical protein
MEELSSDARAIVAAFSTQKHQETGHPGLVVLVSDDTQESPDMVRRHVFYVTLPELEKMVSQAHAIDQTREAFVLIVDGPSMKTEIVPLETRH